MVLAIERAAHQIDAMAGVRAAIITGKGEKSFCAGGDIEAWSAWNPKEFAMAWVRHGHRAFDALARLRQPLIAALNGHTLGGGLELAATADFRIAEEQVKLGSPEIGIGIIPGWSGTQRTVRRFGPRSATSEGRTSDFTLRRRSQVPSNPPRWMLKTTWICGNFALYWQAIQWVQLFHGDERWRKRH